MEEEVSLGYERSLCVAAHCVHYGLSAKEAKATIRLSKVVTGNLEKVQYVEVARILDQAADHVKKRILCSRCGTPVPSLGSPCRNYRCSLYRYSLLLRNECLLVEKL